MLYFNKLKYIFLVLIACIFLQQNVQAQGCVDTIISKQFDVENFGGTFWGNTNYQDGLGNLYLLGNRRTITPNNLKNTLVKFNANKKIIWSKSYPGSLGFDDFAAFRGTIGQDKDQNLYYVSRANFGVIGTLNNQSFLKLDSSGNILANKLMMRQTPPLLGSGFRGINNSPKIFSTLISSYAGSNGVFTFAAVDKDLTIIRWSRWYRPGFSNFIYSNGYYSVELDDTTAIISTLLHYKTPLNTTDTIYTFNFVKINSLTGNIVAQKSYSCFSTLNPNKSISVYPSPVNINYATKEVIYQFNKASNNGTAYSFLKIDENLNIINFADYFTTAAFGIYNFNNISSNEIILNATYIQSGVTKFATISWNSNLQLLSQRSFYSNQFTGNSFYTNLTSKNTNNTVNYFITTNGLFIQNDNPIYLFDNTKNPNFEFDCSDKANDLFTPVTAYIFRADTASLIEQPGLNYSLINNPNTYTAQNNNFTESRYCDLISICNSLKIRGKSFFCLNAGNIDSFKIDRNSSCLRKTIWSVNNMQMQILQSNDSTSTVKFLQPFKGYIKATYENCNVADSFYIEVDTVFNAKTGVYLGNDTVQCIGKAITLNAGNGFKEYTWQDGSTLNTFTSSSTGLFYVTVKDSCNNIFKDSITIQPNLKKLNLIQTGTLCEYDTAKITLPNQFTNYLWQPVANSLINGNTLFLFPTDNTLYTISAESHNNCRIADTLQIIKKNCYGSLYFPTAFTPNNDGKNDSYKPGAVGILKSYEFSIFNRYGEIVFTTNNIATGWDGMYKGKLLSGAYTWVCNYTFRRGKAETETGSFILIR